MFSGFLSSDLSRLASAALIGLELNGNVLSGVIPSELGLLSNLQHFLIQENRLTGSVPHEVVSLVAKNTTALVSFNITGNDFSDGDDSVQQLCWLDPIYYGDGCIYDQWSSIYWCGCDCTC